ncbi:C1 family peptidase [Verrucomicrobiota bacterium]
MKKLLVLIPIALIADLALAVPNPAALYCERLGYDYRVVETPQGAKGVVTVEPGVEFDAWDFFKGKVGNEYSYGALHGYDTECVRKDMGTYVAEYAVCISREGVKAAEGIPLLELMEQNGEPLIDPIVHNKSGALLRDSDNTDGKDQGLDENILARVAREALPSSFDWRSKDGHSYIGSVKNQGSCGSCYAFGANAAAEGTYNWAVGKYNGDCADFSESYIIWCLGRLPAYTDDFYGCDGASYAYAELTALCTEGVGNESDYAYTQSDPGSCTHWGDTTTVFSSWGRIDCGDVDAIKTAITTYGPVDAAVYVGTDFQNYTGGIFEDARTNCYSSPCYYTPVNHAIALVGWDDNGGAETNGYWILRNSWGTSWGSNGYMRIKYTSARVACEACYLVYSTNTHTLTVTSEHGGADPATGVHTIAHGVQTTCRITNSPVDSGSTQYACVGWTGTGSVPTSGTDTNTGAFSMTNDSTITWLWETNVLATPTDISASDGTYTDKVEITWGTVTNATGYELWRSLSNNVEGGTLIAEVSDTSHDDTSAEETTTYYYWVKSTNSSMSSGFSSSDSGYRSASTPTLDAPTGVSASDGTYTNKIQVTWSAVSGATSYEIWRNTSDSSGSAASLATAAATSYDDTSAAALQSFFYWVKAKDSFETSDFSGSDLGYVGTSVTVINDFDGDGRSDIAVYHGASGYWYILYSSSSTLSYMKFGASGYDPVSGDYDGDHRGDLTVYHETSGYWYILYSSDWSLAYQKFGESGYSPAPGDFDGDGKSDLVVYHEASGYWFILCSSSSSLAYQKFGALGYSAVPGDYDGDGKNDLTVYHELSGYWYILYSSDWSLSLYKLGEEGYTPVPGDYDGDGKSDLAVYHEASGYWYMVLSSDWSLSYAKLGEPGYTAVKGDYDGDGKRDLTVYHETSGYWYIQSSSSGELSLQKLGEPGYSPIQ